VDSVSAGQRIVKQVRWRH